jgi:hypothetical protein
MVYYSQLSYAQASPEMAKVVERPSKPEELVLIDDLFGLNMSLVDGAYVDQPWLVTQLMIEAVRTREMSRVSLPVATPSEE